MNNSSSTSPGKASTVKAEPAEPQPTEAFAKLIHEDFAFWVENWDGDLVLVCEHRPSQQLLWCCFPTPGEDGPPWECFWPNPLSCLPANSVSGADWHLAISLLKRALHPKSGQDQAIAMIRLLKLSRLRGWDLGKFREAIGVTSDLDLLCEVLVP